MTTPHNFVEALLEREVFHGGAYDPLVGLDDGHIKSVLVKEGLWTDRFVNNPNNVITHPGYNGVDAVINHWLSKTLNKLAVLTRADFLFSLHRYEEVLQVSPPNRVYLSTRRMMPAERRGGGSYNYAWLVWDAQFPAVEGETLMSWFTPQGSCAIPVGPAQ